MNASSTGKFLTTFVFCWSPKNPGKRGIKPLLMELFINGKRVCLQFHLGFSTCFPLKTTIPRQLSKCTVNSLKKTSLHYFCHLTLIPLKQVFYFSAHQGHHKVLLQQAAKKKNQNLHTFPPPPLCNTVAFPDHCWFPHIL